MGHVAGRASGSPGGEGRVSPSTPTRARIPQRQKPPGKRVDGSGVDHAATGQARSAALRRPFPLDQPASSHPVSPIPRCDNNHKSISTIELPSVRHWLPYFVPCRQPGCARRARGAWRAPNGPLQPSCERPGFVPPSVHCGDKRHIPPVRTVLTCAPQSAAHPDTTTSAATRRRAAFCLSARRTSAQPTGAAPRERPFLNRSLVSCRGVTCESCRPLICPRGAALAVGFSSQAIQAPGWRADLSEQGGTALVAAQRSPYHFPRAKRKERTSTTSMARHPSTAIVPHSSSKRQWATKSFIFIFGLLDFDFTMPTLSLPA
jgi:hypothetical protein